MLNKCQTPVCSLWHITLLTSFGKLPILLTSEIANILEDNETEAKIYIWSQQIIRL